MKFSIRSAVLLGALGLGLIACDANAGDTGSSPTSTSTTSEATTTSGGDVSTAPSSTASTTSTSTSTTSTSVPAATCSADGLVVTVQQPQGDLPAEVAARRDEILAAATDCDFEKLGQLALANSTAYSFGGGSDPGGFWSSGEANGQKPLAAMVQLLNLEPIVYDVGEGNVFYVWPAVYALPNWSDATETQRQELADIFGANELADWDSFDSYLGYRLGITTDGRWTFFLAGD